MNSHHWSVFWGIGLSLFVALPAIGDDGSAGPYHRVFEAARARTLPEDAPKPSDVIMRSLTLRVGKDDNEYDTCRALSDFHVTRLEWAYIQNKEAIVRIRQSGRLFGGAASASLAHVAKTPETNDYNTLACVDLNGRPVVPTWKRTWNPPGSLWMCMNNPAVERAYLAYLKKSLDAGAQVMQRDEPSGNIRATDWGGCFCAHCMAGFRRWLGEKTTPEDRKRMGIEELATFDYRERLLQDGAPVGDAFRQWDDGELKKQFLAFQTEATIDFHRRTRAALNEYAGRRVAVSCNNGCRLWTPIELGFDWCFGELSFGHARPEFIHDAMRQAEQLDRCQVITMPKKSNRENLEAWCRLTRQTIAMSYACGGHCMVPWDVYMPGDEPRYFGTPEQYADLFGFIRASAPYLDGYQYAGASGPTIACDLYGEAFPVELSEGRPIYAVLRAVPERGEEAVVLHMVDWSERPEAFSIKLHSEMFFGDKPLQVTLLQPTLYDQEEHAEADRTGSYESLCKRTPLNIEPDETVSLPPLDPWGMLIVQPE